MHQVYMQQHCLHSPPAHRASQQVLWGQQIALVCHVHCRIATVIYRSTVKGGVLKARVLRRPKIQRHRYGLRR